MEVQLIYNVVFLVYNKVCQLYICIYTFIFFHYSLLQDIEYSSLCYTVRPCCSPLSIFIYLVSYFWLH